MRSHLTRSSGSRFKGSSVAMKATMKDGAYTFETVPEGDKFIGTVWSNIAGAYEISAHPDPGHQSGKIDPGHEWSFDSFGRSKGMGFYSFEHGA
jgi:hypothetical protein